MTNQDWPIRNGLVRIGQSFLRLKGGSNVPCVCIYFGVLALFCFVFLVEVDFDKVESHKTVLYAVCMMDGLFFFVRKTRLALVLGCVGVLVEGPELFCVDFCFCSCA